jgi:hypothetical protein
MVMQGRQLGEGFGSIDKPKPLTHSLCGTFSVALSHKERAQ